MINYPKHIAGMKAKPPYIASCYGYMYLTAGCRVKCDLRKMCITKSKINKRNENKKR